MATYTKFTKDDISSAARDTFRSALEDYLTDPTSQIKRHFIYEREPHVKSSDFDGYPVIYFDDYNIEDVDETVNGNNIMWQGSVTLILEVEEEKPDQLDDLSDQLIGLIKGGDGRAKLNEYGVIQPTLERNQRTQSINASEKFIIRREIEVGYRTAVSM